MGSPSSFRRKRPFISLKSSASIENLPSSQRARARARANHAKNDAQKGCAMQLNGITLRWLHTVSHQFQQTNIHNFFDDFQDIDLHFTREKLQKQLA